MQTLREILEAVCDYHGINGIQEKAQRQRISDRFTTAIIALRAYMAKEDEILTALLHCINVLTEYERKPGSDLEGFMNGALDNARRIYEEAKKYG